jgi:integrase
LIAVQTEEIEAALEALLRAGLKRSTVEHTRAVLSAAYTGAIRAKLAAANPVSVSELPGRPDAPRVRQLRLSEDTARRVSDAVADHPLRAFVEILLNMGFRPAEALALRWEDVNPIQAGVIHVAQAVKQVGSDWSVGTPKTAHSTRDVPTPPELRAVLFQHFHRFGKPTTGWLFPSPDRPGQPENPVRVAKMLRPVFDEAGLPWLTPRDLRSLNATLLLAKGADIRVVSKRLGHADPTTTWRRYAGVVTEEDRVTAERLSIWGRLRRPKPEQATRRAVPGRNS